ncbi:PREDICTED: uncharacterized protein LOC108359531 [Rhagoletis zephyria]|uniref:uncharacterized protein LOC108359531 n=1 Tax=Rhagoletis zephyria TaxID=28612 RepID=UPI0008119191|nr:PREDICTED: uncharacterized protein LOC108359531 [Rhagoletis zephyria]
MTLMNPSAPSMIALPKIHKPGNPMRPIINHKSAPGYKLSKYLKSLLKEKLELPNKYTITNTAELIERMKSLEIPKDAKFVSFDVKDLYQSIPTAETVTTLTKTLIEKTDKNVATEIVNTLRVTPDQNYFKFNNKIYRQTNGLGMGNPTSAILMEVFMQHLEEKYMTELTTSLGVKFYARYVDDIICLVTGDKEEQILGYLNDQHTNINFTMDKENEGKINYLDITI